MKSKINCKGCKALINQGCSLGYSTQLIKDFNPYLAPTESCPKPTTEKMLKKIERK